jgi:recombinational DNA repair protein (RecF pathway)
MDTFRKEVACYDGYASVAMFVYFGSGLNMDECAGCSQPTSDDENVVAYYFEVRVAITSES